MKLLLFALLLLPALVAADPPLVGDADYLAARDAFRVGDAAKLDRLATRLKQSPLEPYLSYYQLRMRLETADAVTIKAFIARPNDTPVIDRLRAEWLKSLAKKTTVGNVHGRISSPDE